MRDPEDDTERDRKQLKNDYDSTPGSYVELADALKRHLAKKKKTKED